MIRYIVVSAVSGILFGIMDGLINANPLAQRLYRIFEPIARKSINIPAGFAIDLIYGFAMAGIFLLFQGSLPGESWVVKGLVFGLVIFIGRLSC
jgi:hypothetical protein